MSALIRALGVLAFVATMLLIPPPARAEKLEPKDSAASAPGYTTFRKQLLRAVVRRDARFVESILAPDILFSFGGGNGRAEFRKTFRLQNPRSEFWNEMETILKMAGAYDSANQTVWQPYLYHAWPDKVDAFTHAVATGRGIPVRKAPAASSPIVATLDYDLVEVTMHQPWMKIKTAAGVVGYVPRGSLYCPVWRRAAFKQVKGAWRMTVFVAGD